MIVISGKHTLEERVLALGAAEFVVKPVRMVALVELIDRLAHDLPPGDQP